MYVGVDVEARDVGARNARTSHSLSLSLTHSLTHTHTTIGTIQPNHT